MQLSGKKIAVLGLGEENVTLLNYLFSQKIDDITILEKKSQNELKDQLKKLKSTDYKLIVGENYLEDLDKFDLIFRTPGLPYHTKEIQQAKQNGVEISSQTKLFFSLCPCPIIGITGTKGKGTTTTLISQILKENFKDSKRIFVGGNIGNAPIEFIQDINIDDLVVLELSSFQLQDLDRSPHIGVVLNIDSDHLDYHKDRDEYVEAKKSIVKFQNKNDFAVINADYLTSFEFAALTKGQVFYFSKTKSVDLGAYVINDSIYLNTNSGPEFIAKTFDVTLRGKHNLENICAAITATHLAGADLQSIKKVVKSFKGLEHRLEFVAEKQGVKFYNDSFSTTPETAIAAINSFAEPIILICGGSEKGADYKKLAAKIAQSSVKTLIAIGITGPKITDELNKHNHSVEIIDSAKNLSDVFRFIKNKMRQGDIVLLSPASASFDWFENYKQRGNLFKKEVENL